MRHTLDNWGYPITLDEGFSVEWYDTSKWLCDRNMEDNKHHNSFSNLNDAFRYMQKRKTTWVNLQWKVMAN